MNVFELFATLGIDTSEYDAGLDSAESKGSQFGQTLGAVVGTGAKVATASIGALTVATVAGTTALVNGVSDVAKYGDEIQKNSQKIGLSTEKYQELDYILNIAGTSMDQTMMGMKTMNNTLYDAQQGSAEAIEKFEKLGLSLEDVQNMSQDEAFETIVKAFQEMPEGIERTALATDIFGKSGQNLIPLFNMTNEEMDSLIETANDYGLVMDDSAIQASATFQDSLTTMQGTLEGLKNNLLSEFLPSFSTIMDGLSAIFAGDDSGLALINEGVNDFIENLNEVAPMAMEIGATILTALITAISSNLPSLLSEGGNVLNMLIQGIISALPSLLQSAIMIIGMIGQALLDNAGLLMSTALQLIIMLATGLTDALPALVPAIVSVVHEMVTILTEPSMLQLLIECALQLILALCEGILLATPELVGMIPEIYGNIIMTLTAEFPNILSAVVELLGILGAEVFAIIGGLLGMNYDQIASALVNSGNLINDAFAKIKNWFANLSSDLISKVTSMWNSITEWFTNGLNDAYSTVSSVLGSISDTFSSIFDTVVSIVTTAIDTIKGLFDFEWSLPDIKLPHFSVTGSLDLLADPPKYPSVSVDWYQKGYSDAYILNGATIFGSQGGSLLGAGEGTGSEVVVGTDKLISMMSEAVREAMGAGQTIIVPVYIGNEKIDELVVKSNQRNDYISGGR